MTDHAGCEPHDPWRYIPLGHKGPASTKRGMARSVKNRHLRPSSGRRQEGEPPIRIQGMPCRRSLWQTQWGSPGKCRRRAFQAISAWTVLLLQYRNDITEDYREHEQASRGKGKVQYACWDLHGSGTHFPGPLHHCPAGFDSDYKKRCNRGKSDKPQDSFCCTGFHPGRQKIDGHMFSPEQCRGSPIKVIHTRMVWRAPRPMKAVHEAGT